MSALVFQDVRKQYPDGTVALHGVTFSVRPGEAVALLGSNGSGKSTLLRCALGLDRATSGVVRVADVDATLARRRQLRRLRLHAGMVFQKINLIDQLSVLSNVIHGALGRSRDPRLWTARTAPDAVRREALGHLQRVGLAHVAARRADRLSGGQRQRVALARLLMQDPQLVLADEPVASLDPRAGREVMELLLEIARERGLTVVCALHQLELARDFSDRIVGLRDGRVVLDAATAQTSAEQLSALYADEHRGEHVQADSEAGRRAGAEQPGAPDRHVHGAAVGT